MVLDINDAAHCWASVTVHAVGQVLCACADLLGQITFTAHGPLGDIYAEYEYHGELDEDTYLGEPETVITVWTQTLVDGTKTLSIKASFDDPDMLDIVEMLFDAVDGYVGEPRASRHWVL